MLEQQQQQMGSPLWALWRTAERAPQPFQQQHQQQQLQVPQDHMTVRRETCRVETRDGFRVLRCEEVKEVFRCAANGQREIVEKTESSSVRPYEQPSFTSTSTSSAASRYEDAVNGPLGPVVSASLGQMLDDFFQYAAELQQSLEQQDAADSSGSWSPWGGSSSSDNSSSSHGVDSSSRLFSWWQRRKPATAAAATAGAGSAQPSLTQLVRDSSSDVQEI